MNDVIYKEHTDGKYVTKDSGVREEFETGAKRDSREGKGRFDLLTPLAIRRLAGVYERGAAKYGDHNWQRGMPLGRYMDSALRHLFDYMEGKRDEDHLAQAMWNVAAMIHTEEMIERGHYPKELDDMMDYTLVDPPAQEETVINVNPDDLKDIIEATKDAGLNWPTKEEWQEAILKARGEWCDLCQGRCECDEWDGDDDEWDVPDYSAPEPRRFGGRIYSEPLPKKLDYDLMTAYLDYPARSSWDYSNRYPNRTTGKLSDPWHEIHKYFRSVKPNTDYYSYNLPW